MAARSSENLRLSRASDKAAPIPSAIRDRVAAHPARRQITFDLSDELPHARLGSAAYKLLASMFHFS